MRITYSVRDICDFVGATIAQCQISLYGRWCNLSVTAYCLGEDPFDETAVAISYGIRPLPQSDLRCSSSDGMLDGILGLARGTGSQRQNFEQAVTFPLIIGQFFDKQTVADGGVPVARELMANILRATESMIETIRRSIRCSFPGHVRDIAIAKLEDRYGPVTKKTIQSLLGQIHWRLMLQKSGCDEQQLGCIEFMAEHNPPRYFDISFDGDNDIPLSGELFGGDVVAGMRDAIRLAHAARARRNAQEAAERNDARLVEANGKATSLLQSICGEKLAREFSAKGYITIQQDGFKFEIPPAQFVRCTDPNGKRAELCIHTQGFQCNPIDEIILAYLHIRHKLAAYMKEAVVHGAQSGFTTVIKAA